MKNQELGSIAAAWTATLAASLFSFGVQAAQEGAASPPSQETTLSEITVTAERYSSTVQTTPVAVSAFDAPALATQNITSIQTIADAIPGVVLVPTTGSSNAIRVVMRGADQETGGFGVGVVGIYIDGVYQPSPTGAFFDFFDVGRVEVLRGPQGTLYGRSTSGGAIKVETLTPSFTWTGGGEVTDGIWNDHEAKAYLSGPVIDDKLAFSVSGVIRQHDGFIDDVNYDRRLGKIDRRGERAKLLFTPTDKLTIDFSAFALQDYSDPGIGVPLTLLPGQVDPYATGGGRDLTKTEVFGPIYYKLNNTGASVNATYALSDAMQVNSITGYGDLRTESSGSATLAQQQPGQGLSQGDFWTQELNMTYNTARLKAVAGLYYYYETGISRATVNNSPTTNSNQDQDSKAAYGQLTYNVGDGVGLTAGLRYTRDAISVTQFPTGLLVNGTTASATFPATTPKLGVDWQITPKVLTYFSWTKGFKAGGINPINATAASGEPFGPEFVESYEVGTKFTSPDNRFRINVALYDAVYNGLQQPTFFPGTLTIVTAVAAGAVVRGIELEPTWQVTDSLQLYSAMSTAGGHYTSSFLCANPYNVYVDCSSNYIKGVIPWEHTSGLIYTVPLMLMPGKLTFRASVRHWDKYYNNVANAIDLVQSHAETLYDGSIGWTSTDGHWRVTLDGRNIMNEHYVQAGLQTGNATSPGVTGYIGNPRELVLRAGLNY